VADHSGGRNGLTAGGQINTALRPDGPAPVLIVTILDLMEPALPANERDTVRSPLAPL